jgi:acetate kinase
LRSLDNTDTVGIMAPAPTRVLTVNARSSSVKFAVFEDASAAKRPLQAHLHRIGLDGTKFSWAVPDVGPASKT